MNKKQNRKAFTLVELLVVIGIIGVLISILLPSLQKARQQANLLVCSSNLKNIGNLVQTYAAENHGFFPYGKATMHWNGYGNSYNYGDWNTPTWNWTDSLALLMNKSIKGQPSDYNYLDEQNEALEFPGIFHDVDGVQQPYAPAVIIGGVQHQECCDFTANIRVFPDVGYPDFSQPLALANKIINGSTAKINALLPIRQTGSFKRSDEVMMIWCGAADLFDLPGYSEGADPISWQLDDAAIVNNTQGHCFLYPQPPLGSKFKSTYYNNPIGIGNDGIHWSGAFPANVTAATLASSNMDPVNVQYDGLCDMRFRHMGNTTANFLFLDGHVESRMLGQVLAKDICLNPVNPGALPPISP